MADESVFSIVTSCAYADQRRYEGRLAGTHDGAQPPQPPRAWRPQLEPPAALRGADEVRSRVPALPARNVARGRPAGLAHAEHRRRAARRRGVALRRRHPELRPLDRVEAAPPQDLAQAERQHAERLALPADLPRVGLLAGEGRRAPTAASTATRARRTRPTRCAGSKARTSTAATSATPSAASEHQLHPDGARPTTVFTAGVGGQRGVKHPAVMAKRLALQLVSLSTPPGELVLDPFCGSGTTGLACIERGRDFLGIEIEPAYIEEARERLEAASAAAPLFVA
jgi:hypothetical protein